MQQPIEGTLFFAGEGLHRGPEIGTVEGALVSGRDAANRLINSFTA
jgi:monoamine oxidase